MESLEARALILREENKNLKKIMKKTIELKEQENFTIIQGTVINRLFDDWYSKVAIN